MKKSDISQAVSILANVGVILGIVFLAIEISQNTAMMQSQMAQARAESAMMQAESIYNSVFIPPLLVAIDSGQPLTAEEEERFLAYIRAFHRNQDNIFRQRIEGLLGPEIEESVRGAIRKEVASRAPARLHWEQSNSAYSTEYRLLVDEVIEEFLAE